MTNYDVTVIGAGPAGLAAALAAEKKGKRVLLVERAARMGGILNQCIHDGFGLIRFGEKLSGCEYANLFICKLKCSAVETALLTFVTRIEKRSNVFEITLVNRDGLRTVKSKALVLATGCRERTAKQVSIQGTRPAGVFTAGTAQYYINIMGQMPAQKCVILGSGDIGLIMARRLTLEGAEVVGVYEAKPTPSGLTRNIVQCLDDFDIPLHVSHTVTRVFGESRLSAVEIAQVDEKMQPIPGTEEIIDCDSLILSVGLIPENELAETMHIVIDSKTKGPTCDQNYETSLDGVFVRGNALHVNDLVDYVSESGDAAGNAAAEFNANKRTLVDITAANDFAYAVPAKLDVNSDASKTALFFRSREIRDNIEVKVLVNSAIVYKKKYTKLRPPEMERIVVDFSHVGPTDKVTLEMRTV